MGMGWIDGWMARFPSCQFLNAEVPNAFRLVVVSNIFYFHPYFYFQAYFSIGLKPPTSSVLDANFLKSCCC